MTTSPYETPIYSWRSPDEYDLDWYTEFASMMSTIENTVFGISTEAASIWTTVSANSAAWGSADTWAQTASGLSGYWEDTHTTVSANSGAWSTVTASATINSFSPEYPGFMSAVDNTTDCTLSAGWDATNHHAYYDFFNSQGVTEHGMSAIIRMQYPQDTSNMSWNAAGELAYALTWRVTNVNQNPVSCYVFDTADAIVENMSAEFDTVIDSRTWHISSFDVPGGGPGGTWTAGGWFTFLILAKDANIGHFIYGELQLGLKAFA